MSNWQVGDLAIALVDLPPSTIKRGQFLTVSRLVHHPMLGMGLCFRDITLPTGYSCCDPRCFLKVTPPPEMIEAERKAGVPA